MYEILAALMREYNVKASEISKATGISSSVFTDWKKGRYTPKIDKLEKIARYFGLSASVFFIDISELPSYLWEHNPKNDKSRLEKTALYACAAGDGSFNETYPSEFRDLDDSDSEEYSWCRIEGDSMYPVLMDGDLIKVHHQTETSPTDLTVVKVDGEHATCKHVEIVGNGVWLRAINKDAYADRFFSIQEVLTLPVTIIGKAVEMRRGF